MSQLLTMKDLSRAFSDLSDEDWVALVDSGELDAFLPWIPGPELPVRFLPTPFVQARHFTAD